MTQKQPQAGEWWQKEDTRVFIIGVKKNGLIVGETECGTLIPFMPIHGWQHLPDCDSWTWRPEVFPQYWTPYDPSCDAAYVIRTSKLEYTIVYKNGDTCPHMPWNQSDTNLRTQLTKEQADALLDKPQESPPLPSPERVPVRLYWYDGNIVGRYDHSQPTDPSFQEIHSDGNGGWYVEVQQ